MSGISYLKRINGSTNNLVYLVTSDTTATATAVSYITNQAANIAAINEGTWTWESNDCIMLSASDGLSWCSIDASFTTLTAFSGAGAGDVTHSGALTIGDLPKWSTTSGNLIDSGILATNVVTKNTVNQMAAAAGIALDKGTGSVVTNAVTINHQAGVITTGALSTASGAAATAIALTNSFITTSSVILCQVMGGTNTTDGIDIIATPTGTGTANIVIFNNNVSGTALSGGTVIIGFVVL